MSQIEFVKKSQNHQSLKFNNNDNSDFVSEEQGIPKKIFLQRSDYTVYTENLLLIDEYEVKRLLNVTMMIRAV